MFAYSQTFVASAQPFLDATGYCRGISWVDIDNDGDQDVYISGTGAYDPGTGTFAPLHMLYLNDGSANFTLSTQLQSASSSMSNCFGDIDNDGDFDVLVAKPAASGASELYYNDGSGNFSLDMSTSMSSFAGTYEGSVDWGDYDNDGDLDMYMVRWNSFANRLHRNNGNGTFTQMGTAPIATDGAWTSVGIWGDVDNDGDLDMFVGNYTAANRIYVNDGAGGFTALAGAGSILTDSENTRDANWVDYNNDGYFDIYVANQSSTDRLYRNNGDNTFTDVTGIGPFNSGSSWSSNWGDFDNDGDLDLMSIGLSGSTNSRFLRNDGGSFTQINPSSILPTSFSGSNSTTALFTDANNDGWLDVHILYPGNGAADYFYLNEGSVCKNWIEIDLQGTTSNRKGLGAKIGVKANVAGTSVWQYRLVTATSAKAGHNMIRSHFGLGDAVSIDSLRVWWPSGTVTDYLAVDVNQIMTIVEGGALAPQVGPLPDCATIALPVELIDFTVTADRNHVDLEWSTAMEVDNDYFILERRGEKDAGWFDIGKVDGQVNSSSTSTYHWVDEKPLNGIAYYRLVQVDMNGEKEYHQERVVNLEPIEDIFPNPVKDRIFVKGSKDLKEISLMDVMGVSTTIPLSSVNETILYGDVSKLSPGVYYIQVGGTNKKVVVAR